jgi:hypothetical protein
VLLLLLLISLCKKAINHSRRRPNHKLVSSLVILPCGHRRGCCCCCWNRADLSRVPKLSQCTLRNSHPPPRLQFDSLCRCCSCCRRMTKGKIFHSPTHKRMPHTMERASESESKTPNGGGVGAKSFQLHTTIASHEQWASRNREPSENG